MGTKCCKFDVCSNKVCRTEPFYNLISSCMFMSLKIWTAWVQFFFFFTGKNEQEREWDISEPPPTPTPHEPQPCLKQEELIYSGVLLQNRKPCPAPSNRGFWRHKSRQRSKQQCDIQGPFTSVILYTSEEVETEVPPENSSFCYNGLNQSLPERCCCLLHLSQDNHCNLKPWGDI